ncbi:dynein axonemal intermediate chain 7 [Brachyistius frenatus]|uniref:dynein axonemal intermediate chain 7 n=1 Tax=Brachyistius frenatus TaxID=100188 RepID=UPI0037E79AE7
MPTKKGKKLSKTQKAKLLQEEEEKRLRDEEESRLQEERDEEERLERERKEKDIEKLELKDQERREDELNELGHLLEENHIAVTKWKNDVLEAAKWERYMRCDGAPDPAVPREINSYVTLWRDDPEINMTLVLKEFNLALRLVEELDGLLKDGIDPQESHKYQESLIALLELIHSKLLLSTEEILKNASSNIDTETGNMQTVIRDENVTLCLWANIKMNPRFKGLNFDEVGMGFQLPKQMAVSDIAIRILRTRYDHLSLLARMTHLRTDTPSCRSLVGNEEERGRKREVSPQPEEGQIQTQMQVDDAEGKLTPPPEQLLIKNGGTQVVDLMQYTPLGGVFYYDVFRLPPQAHRFNGWEIRQLLRTGLQLFEYPSENFEAITYPPVGVSVTLPDSAAFLVAPQVARWDTAGKQWRMDGITDISYEEAEATISFNMDSFQAFVLLQETYANLPFQSWELRPLGQDSALFTVSGALIDLSITVQDNQCMLQSKQDKGFSHLTGKWMSGPALQRAMPNTGINIFVNEYTDKYISSCGKDPLTEHAAYEQMALFASACAFSWSKWNAKCGAEHLVMQVCEHLGPAPVPKDSWSLYLLKAQRSQKLEITEKSDAFSPDHHPGSEFHSTFIHMLQDDMSPDGIARSRKSHHLFVDTVQSLLCATRPLMYS